MITTPSSKHTYQHYLYILGLMVLLTLSACNLGSSAETPEPIPTEDDAQETNVPEMIKPTVEIISPNTGDEFVVEEPILVSINAVDSVGVTRLQLFANGSIVKTVSSEAIAGDRILTAVLDYTPRASGTVNMQVLAFRGSIASDPAELQVTVRQSSNQVQSTAQPNPNVPQIPNDGVCRALTNVNLNFRRQPTTAVDNVITVLPNSTLAPILARLGDNSWWKIQYGTNIGWVSSSFTTEYGNCSGIPVESFSTPTPNVTETLAPTLTPRPTNTPVNSPTPALPDLIITAIEGDEAVTLASSGDTIVEYAITVTNIGQGDAGQFEVALAVLLGTDSTVLDAGVVSELGRGQSITLVVEVTFDSAGTYTLRADADSGDILSEVSNVNNRGDIDVVVSP